MKRLAVSMFVFLNALTPGFAAETSDSLPDAVPACMERNGPDCVLPGQVVPRRATAPVIVTSPPVVVPPVSAPPTVISPQGKLPPRGTVPPAGAAGAPEFIVPSPNAPASPNTLGNSNIIAPSGQGSTIISPRK